MENKRKSNIQLLRIITMMGVILFCYNNSTIGGGFQYVEKGSANQYIYCTAFL